MANQIKWQIPLNKVTRGTMQYKDQREEFQKHMIYVPKDELAKIGNPVEVEVIIRKVS